MHQKPYSATQIVHTPLLRGWLVVRGAHRTPLSGLFKTRAEAVEWLARRDHR